MDSFIPEQLRKFVKIKKTIKDDFNIFTYTVYPITEKGLLKGKKLKLDDYTYKLYPQLVDIVPRGFSILYCKDKEVCRLDGLKKFDGSSILDDDSNVDTHLIDYNIISKWENENKLEVVFQEKANGKMATFKIFEYNNEIYIFGGSKNVHKVYKYNETITHDDLSSNILNRIKLDNLPIEKILNKTIICEYVDGRHIVYAESPYMIYFSDSVINNVKEIFPRQQHLPTEEQYKFIRNMENTEGVVVIYKNIKTGETFRQKHKSVWYILIRVIRESLCRVSDCIESTVLHSKVMSVFKKRSDDFLFLPEAYIQIWSERVFNFINYVKLNYNFIDLSHSSSIGMATVWYNFINDITFVKEKNEFNFVSKEMNNLIDYGTELVNNGLKVCYIMRGPSGIGKSTLCDKLKKTYLDCSVFSTDSYFVDGYDYSKLGEYHDKNYTAFSECNSIVLCVDNTNLTYNDFNRYIRNAKNRSYITIILSFPIGDSNILLQRSKHISSIGIINNMLKKYKFTPKLAYYGIFVTSDLSSFNPKQTTPLHITCGFYSKNTPLNVEEEYGKKIKIYITGLSVTKFGRCLVVELKNNENFYKMKNIKHITLETFIGFKPVDVGKNIIKDQITPLDIEICGIYGPIY